MSLLGCNSRLFDRTCLTQTNRRELFSLVATCVATPVIVHALDNKATLQDRFDNNDISPINIGIETPDVYYPRFFAGSWTTESTTESVAAPAVRLDDKYAIHQITQMKLRGYERHMN